MAAPTRLKTVNTRPMMGRLSSLNAAVKLKTKKKEIRVQGEINQEHPLP
jgi:hypothetical protein